MKGILDSIRAEIADVDSIPLVIGGDFNGYVASRLKGVSQKRRMCD